MRKLTFITIFAILGIALSASLLLAGKSIVIKGSDTMIMAGQAWAEAYMKKHPEVTMSVQGGGSGTGISALMQSTCDICEASRAMTKSEISKCHERNVIPVATTVALDGIAMAVNAENPIKTLTLAQIKDIYTGKVSNWNEVGGNDMPIVVLSRENSSGTYAFLREFVLKNERYTSKALMMPTTKSIQAEVSNNPRAIGYGGEAYFKGKKNCKIVPVCATASSTPEMPTDANVRSGKYPISRPLYCYTAGKPGGEIASYLKFILGDEGQALAGKLGYVTLK